MTDPLVALLGLDYQPLWEICRTINKYLGILVGIFVMWRLVPQVLDPERWRNVRALHLMLWFTFIAAASLNASAGALTIQATPNWTSGTRTALSLFAIVLCLWWPHPRKFIPVEMKPYGTHQSGH